MSSEEYSEPTVMEAVSQKLDDLPASTPSEAAVEADAPSPPPPAGKSRLFNRQRSLHEILGGGKPADAFLWRDKFMSAGILAGATVAYFLFEYSGYTIITIFCNLLLVTFVVLFLWSNAAGFLNRSPPPIPNFNISEEKATSLALAIRSEVNRVLAIAHDIVLGKDFKHFLKVMAVLWGLAKVGGWFHFLTLIYLVIVFAHSVPIVYEKYEDQIEAYAKIAFDQAHKHYRKVDDAVLSKLMKKKEH